MLIGYVKIKDKPKLVKLLNDKFSQASVIYEEPSPMDKVPVCISLNRFLSLPNY